MAKRHRDALAINEGASNPLAIANAIASAVREVYDEKGFATQDAAVRLMVHQLAHITDTGRIIDMADYRSIVDECLRKST